MRINYRQRRRIQKILQSKSKAPWLNYKLPKGFKNDINAIGGRVKHSVLEWAISLHANDVVEYVLEKGADPNTYVGCGYVIHDAIMAENKEAVSLLMKYGANINLEFGRDDSSLSVCQSLEMFNHVMSFIQDIRTHNQGGHSMMPIAVSSDFVEYVQMLLDSGCLATDTDKDGTPCLAYCHSTQMLDLLLEHGEDINSRVYKGGTILHKSIYGGACMDYIVEIVERGVDIDARNDAGMTAIEMLEKKIRVSNDPLSAKSPFGNLFEMEDKRDTMVENLEYLRSVQTRRAISLELNGVEITAPKKRKM